MSRITTTLVLLFLTVFFASATGHSGSSFEESTVGCNNCRNESEPVGNSTVFRQNNLPQEKQPEKDRADFTCIGCEQQACSATLDTWAQLWAKWFGGSASKNYAEKQDQIPTNGK